MRAPFRHMTEPGTLREVSDHEFAEKLVEGSLKGGVGAEKVVAGNQHVLAVAGNVNALVSALGQLLVTQMGFEDPRGGELVQIAALAQRALKIGNRLGNMLEIHI